MSISEDRIPESIRDQAAKAKFGSPDFYAGPLTADRADSSGEIPASAGASDEFERELSETKRSVGESRALRQERQSARRLMRLLRPAR
jgi:hypothetical protein